MFKKALIDKTLSHVLSRSGDQLRALMKLTENVLYMILYFSSLSTNYPIPWEFALGAPSSP